MAPASPQAWYRPLLALTAAALALVSSCMRSADGAGIDPGEFQFALIGDLPYDELQATNLFPNLIEDINRDRLAFVVHDGDIKAGAAPCTDEVLLGMFAQFQTFRHPLIYLFGDNEWSDCGKVRSQPFAPEERLGKLREIFTAGQESLGRPALALTRQSSEPAFASYRENVRWVMGGVVFTGLNVPGDDNHAGTEEFGPRNAANLAWIRASFALARRDHLRAVMILMQANPHFELPATNHLRRGFNEMLEVFEQETIAFGRPVVLVHGDTHYFRIDQPLLAQRTRRRIENFLRVETFGNPDVHWVKGFVEADNPNVFRFEPRYVKKNLLRH